MIGIYKKVFLYVRMACRDIDLVGVEELLMESTSAWETWHLLNVDSPLLPGDVKQER